MPVLGGRFAKEKTCIDATFRVGHLNSPERQNTCACCNSSEETRIYVSNELDETPEVNLLIVVNRQVAAVWAI